MYEEPKTKAGRLVGSIFRIGIGVAGVLTGLKGHYGSFPDVITNPATQEIASQVGNLAGQATDTILEVGGVLITSASVLLSWKNIKNTVKISK